MDYRIMVWIIFHIEALSLYSVLRQALAVWLIFSNRWPQTTSLINSGAWFLIAAKARKSKVQGFCSFSLARAHSLAFSHCVRPHTVEGPKAPLPNTTPWEVRVSPSLLPSIHAILTCRIFSLLPNILPKSHLIPASTLRQLALLMRSCGAD